MKINTKTSLVWTFVDWCVKLWTLVIIVLVCTGKISATGWALFWWFSPIFFYYALTIFLLVIVLTFALILYIADNQ